MNNKVYKLLMGGLLFFAIPIITRAQVSVGSGVPFYTESGGYVSITGDLEINRDLSGAGTIYMNGTTVQNMGSGLGGTQYHVPVLSVNNNSGIALSGEIGVTQSLTFVNGTITLGAYIFDIHDNVSVTGYALGKHFITNGVGYISAFMIPASANFIFPVGSSSTSYSPLAVTNGATVQTINVAVKDYTGSASNEGTAANGMNRSWQIFTSAGAAISSLSLTHDATLNGSNYYSSGAFITRQQATAGSWSNPNSASFGGIITPAGETGATPTLASISDTYYSNALVLGATATSSSAANSWYSKASRAAGINATAGSIALNTTVLLQGAYNSGTGAMINSLQTSSLLPTASSTAYTTSPRADYANVNSVAGAAGTVTDWVEVQLRDATTPATIIERQSLLVKTNGQVVNEAGGTPLFASLPGSYFITVTHRNHLGARSAATQAFTAGSTIAYDFTTAQNQAYQNPAITTNAAMALSGSKYVLWGGNGNGNNAVRYIGPANDNTYLLSTALNGNSGTILSSVYNNGDYNMNGTVRYIGPANDNSFLLSTVLGGNNALIITQHQ